MSCPFATERVWVDKSKYNDAEKGYFENISKETLKKELSENTKETKAKKPKKKKKNSNAGNSSVEKSITEQQGSGTNQCTLVSEIAKARQHIKNSLERMDGIVAMAASPGSNDVLERLAAVERENASLRETVESLKKTSNDFNSRVLTLEKMLSTLNITQPKAVPVAAVKQNIKQEDDDDGVDLFGSDSEDESAEAAKIREKRLAAYAEKKSKKPALIAKSSLVLDVKPWDDETDLKVMEAEIRKIACDGLLWGASKFVPVAFGIQKLSIGCVVEDEKVSIDWLTEEIEKFEDFVQSVDVAAFNKI